VALDSRAGTPQRGDEALSRDLERARAGDEAAFTRVFRAVQPGLLRYLTALVGNDAEDVASEAWAQACRGLPNFRGDIDGFRGWLATIARRRAIDQLRAKGRRPSGPLPSVDVVDSDAGVLTEAAAFESLSTREAVAMISALPKDQAEAVLLRVVMGLDAKAAGQVLGKRPGAVRAAAFRGLRTLAARLEAETPARNTLPLPDDDGLR
jgi:RNA polymerase sigma-70 factor (ECF subfamily)